MNRRSMLTVMAILPFVGLERALEWLARQRSWPALWKVWSGVDLADGPGQDFSGGSRGKYADIHFLDAPRYHSPHMRIVEIDYVGGTITVDTP